jgi:hypothetical protein
MTKQRTNSAVVTLPFANPRQAALTLLSEYPDLSHKAAGFLGHVCVSDFLTDKQHKWLVSLLEKRGLPPLAGERVE